METGLQGLSFHNLNGYCEQGSQRVTDATTLYKAQKKR
jgi:hypothetical protein